MMATTGFYGNGDETYYVTPKGETYIVSSVDDIGPDPVLIDEMPPNAEPCDSLLTPDECVAYCRAVEVISGETLVTE